MSLFERLEREHRDILAVMDAFDAYAQDLLAGGADQSALADFTRFISEYMDGMHHAAEETILFRAMIADGFSADEGPIGVMLREHDLGRAISVTFAAARGAGLSGDERARLADAIGSLTSLLRAHIMKEERVLYPLARQALPEDSLRTMDVLVERVVKQQGDARTELERLGRGLCERFRRTRSVA